LNVQFAIVLLQHYITYLQQHISYRHPSLGLATKARACKNVGQEEAWESRAKKREGMNPHTPKGTPTLGAGVSVDSQVFKEQLQRLNLLDWGVSYIIGKLLKPKCLKWACMTHLHIWNTSHGQKKGRESNWQFDSRPLKVRNRPNFLACRWWATYRWKALDEGYNFALNLILIGGLQRKLWAHKFLGIPSLGISELPLHHKLAPSLYECFYNTLTICSTFNVDTIIDMMLRWHCNNMSW
jgi:hypothetical protein